MILLLAPSFNNFTNTPLFITMNILSVFREKVLALLDADRISNRQEVNEKLVELATFFYKIDGRISLPEQAYMEELLNSLEWNSTTPVETFQNECIARINQLKLSDSAIVASYLTGLMTRLEELEAIDQAIAIAKEISDADGEIADDEVRYLEVVRSYRSN